MNNSKAYHIIKNTICFLIIFAIQAVMIYFLATGRIAEATNESLQSFVLINAAILGNVLVSIAISLFAHSGVGIFLPNVTNLFIGIAVFVAAVGFQEGFMKVFAVIFFGVVEIIVVFVGFVLSAGIYDSAKQNLIYNPLERIRMQEEWKLQRKKEEEEERRREEEERKKRDALIKKYSYSPFTREIIKTIKRNGELPYTIRVYYNRIDCLYRDRTMESYVYRLFDFPDIPIGEESVFADVLNQKLGNIYDNCLLSYYPFFELERKPTRSF